jgi:hypothetical protein
MEITMPKPKKTPKAQTPKTTPEPLPIKLLALAALLGETERQDMNALLRGALSAASTALRKTPGEYPDAIHSYIDQYAKSGAFKKAVAAAARLDSDQIDLFGGLHNAFAIPALFVGLSVAYLILANDGGAK